MLTTALNRYNVGAPEILGIDLMQMMKENRHDLGLDSKHGEGDSVHSSYN